MRRTIAGAALALVVLASVMWVTYRSAMAPDAAAPPAVARILPAARSHLSAQLDVDPAQVRYTGVESRETDDLVILRFEIRPFPYIASEGAYLFSRCRPIEQLDVSGMGGGRGVVDFETDPELEFLRAADEPCRR